MDKKVRIVFPFGHEGNTTENRSKDVRYWYKWKSEKYMYRGQFVSSGFPIMKIIWSYFGIEEHPTYAGISIFFSLFHCEQLEIRPYHYYRLKISLVLYHRQSPGCFWSTLCCCHPPNRIMSSKGFQIILKRIYGTGMLLCAIVCLCLCPDWMWNPKTSISLTEGARLMEVLEGRLSRVRGLANPGGEPPITLGFRFSRHALFIHLTLNPDLRTMIWWYGDTILDI